MQHFSSHHAYVQRSQVKTNTKKNSHRYHVHYARSQPKVGLIDWKNSMASREREASVLCNTIGLPAKLFVLFRFLPQEIVEIYL